MADLLDNFRRQMGVGGAGGGFGGFGGGGAAGKAIEEIAVQLNQIQQAQGGINVSPTRALQRLGQSIATGVMPDGAPLTRAGVLALLAELGIMGRKLIALRSDSDTLASPTPVSISGQYTEQMGVLCIAMSTGVAVGAVPVMAKVHAATWSMDGTPMFDSQAQPFFPGPAGSSVSFWRIPRGGQLLTGSATVSFPAADVGQLWTFIYEDADAAEHLMELLIGG